MEVEFHVYTNWQDKVFKIMEDKICRQKKVPLKNYKLRKLQNHKNLTTRPEVVLTRGVSTKPEVVLTHGVSAATHEDN